MSLVEIIDSDIKKALLAKDQAGLRGLRAIKSAILLAQTEKSGAESLSKEIEIKILQKQIKQRKESIDIYKAQNREDLVLTEQEEVNVIEKYLPKALSSDEVELDLKRLIQENGISGIKELGKLMSLANTYFAGRADGKTISEIGKKLLG